jgi:hypothetical protein
VPRKRVAVPGPEPPPVIGPVRVIDPHAIFTREEFQAIFCISRNTLRNEIKEKRLRVSKRAGRYWLLGAWILQWFEQGELPVKQRSPEVNGFHQGR